MDPENLFRQAQEASQRATSAVENLPGTLEQFRRNLNEVYNKDNPLIKAREGLLQGFLTAGDKARAELLPQNAGVIFSPTELQAIVSGRQAAALAPLSSLNQLIIGQFGSLKDYVGLGRDVLQAQIAAATQRAQDLMQQYQLAAAARQQQLENELAERKFAEDIRQFNLLHSGGGGVGIAGIGATTTVNKPPAYKPTVQYNRPAGPTIEELRGTTSPQVYLPPTLRQEPNRLLNFLNRFNPFKPSTQTGTLVNIPSGIQLDIRR